MRIALISGATSGMGRDFARSLASEGLDELWLVGRREERLAALQEELAPAVCRYFVRDLTEEGALAPIACALQETGAEVAWTVAAAGYGMIGDFAETAPQEAEGMIALNCTALTALIATALPYMQEGAHILTLASAAAYLPQPGFAVYAATKAYVLHFSRALREELKPRKISVTAVCPGPVKTEFFTRAESGGNKMAVGKERFMTDSPTVVRLAIKAAKKNRAAVTPTASMKFARLGAKLIPHSLLIPLVFKRK